MINLQYENNFELYVENMIQKSESIATLVSISLYMLNTSPATMQ